MPRGFLRTQVRGNREPAVSFRTRLQKQQSHNSNLCRTKGTGLASLCVFTSVAGGFPCTGQERPAGPRSAILAALGPEGRRPHGLPARTPEWSGSVRAAGPGHTCTSGTASVRRAAEDRCPDGRPAARGVGMPRRLPGEAGARARAVPRRGPPVLGSRRRRGGFWFLPALAASRRGGSAARCLVGMLGPLPDGERRRDKDTCVGRWCVGTPSAVWGSNGRVPGPVGHARLSESGSRVRLGSCRAGGLPAALFLSVQRRGVLGWSLGRRRGRDPSWS